MYLFECFSNTAKSRTLQWMKRHGYMWKTNRSFILLFHDDDRIRKYVKRTLVKLKRGGFLNDIRVYKVYYCYLQKQIDYFRREYPQNKQRYPSYCTGTKKHRFTINNKSLPHSEIYDVKEWKLKYFIYDCGTITMI